MRSKVGIEVEVENDEISYHGALNYVNLWSPDWVIEQDGSLRNSGYEIKSNGPQDIELLRGKLCQLYPVLTTSSGTWRAAVHVHVDARTTSWETRAIILAMGYVYDMALFNKYAPERVESNFCVPLQHKTPGVFRCIVDMIEDHRLHNYGKYSSINVLPLQEFGSVEFRHMRTPETSTEVHSVTGALSLIDSYANDCAQLVRSARSTYVQENVNLAEALLKAIEDHSSSGFNLEPDTDALGEVLTVLAEMRAYDPTRLDIASVARVVQPIERHDVRPNPYSILDEDEMVMPEDIDWDGHELDEPEWEDE